MYDASNRKDIRRAEKQAKLDERGDQEILAGLMSTVAGRSWMLRLLESCHIFATSVNRDPILMGYSEGERNVGLRIFTQIVNICPDQYIQMMREGAQRDAAREPRDPDEPNDAAVGGDGTADDSANDTGGIVDEARD